MLHISVDKVFLYFHQCFAQATRPFEVTSRKQRNCLKGKIPNLGIYATLLAERVGSIENRGKHLEDSDLRHLAGFVRNNC